MGTHITTVIDTIVTNFENALLVLGTLSLPDQSLLHGEEHPGNGPELRERANKIIGQADHTLWALREVPAFFGESTDKPGTAVGKRKRKRAETQEEDSPA